MSTSLAIATFVARSRPAGGRCTRTGARAAAPPAFLNACARQPSLTASSSGHTLDAGTSSVNARPPSPPHHVRSDATRVQAPAVMQPCAPTLGASPAACSVHTERSTACDRRCCCCCRLCGCVDSPSAATLTTMSLPIHGTAAPTAAAAAADTATACPSLLWRQPAAACAPASAAPASAVPACVAAAAAASSNCSSVGASAVLASSTAEPQLASAHASCAPSVAGAPSGPHAATDSCKAAAFGSRRCGDGRGRACAALGAPAW
eukprot:10522-Chlamydomonas_euryale.AAC.2